jgi:hypothetical protein
MMGFWGYRISFKSAKKPAALALLAVGLVWLVLGCGVTQIRNNPIRVAMPKEIKAVSKPMLSIL